MVMVCFSLTMLRKLYFYLTSYCLSIAEGRRLSIRIVQSVKLSKSVLCEEIRRGPAEAIGLYFIFMSKEVKQTPI